MTFGRERSLRIGRRDIAVALAGRRPRRLAEPDLLRLRDEADDGGDGRAHVRDAPDLRRASLVGCRARASERTPLPRRRASPSPGSGSSRREARARSPAISAGSCSASRPRRTWAALLGRDRPAHAPLLAVPDQRRRAPVGCVPLFVTSALRARRRRTGASRTRSPGRRSSTGSCSRLVVTNILWFTAIDRVGATRSALYANLQPFLGAVFALLILSEEFTAAPGRRRPRDRRRDHALALGAAARREHRLVG